jgi:predicted N-acetyltransferase YhbS
MYIDFQPYRPDFASQVLQIWNSSEFKERFPLSEKFWQYNTSGQGVNFQPHDFIGAVVNGSLVGFGLTRRFRDLEQNPDMHSYTNLGWISLILVAPEWRNKGIGSALLQKADVNLLGVAKIRLGADLGHFFPGLISGLDDYFFRKRGYFLENSLQFDLQRSLSNWKTPPAPPAVKKGDYFYTQGKPGEEQAILDFLAHAFPGRWRYKIALDFREGIPASDITLLKQKDGKIVGFLECRHPKSANPVPTLALQPNLNWGGIGPLGVDDSVRGGGLGLGLVAAATDYLKSLGVPNIIIDWTTLVDFYAKLGYTPYNSYRHAYKNG